MSCKPLHIEHVWRRLFVLVSKVSPVRVALRWMLPRRDYRKLGFWLRTLEAITRRVLLIEALAAPAPPPLSRKVTPTRPAPEHYEFTFFPQAWRADFRLLQPAPRHTTRKEHERRRRPATSDPATPVARRIEALRRVIAQPERHVRRLARALHRYDVRARFTFARARFGAARRCRSFQRSGRLLSVVQVHANEALRRLAGAGALAGWDSS